MISALVGAGIDGGYLVNPRLAKVHWQAAGRPLLPYLLVTSTLIEGVNTTARNVLVLDNKIAAKKYDYFTFSNISGRSGRMSRHFIGRVVVFNPAPHAAGLNVDVPALSQSPRASEEVLLQLPDHRLTDESRQRLAPYFEQDLVRVETLRQNKGVPAARQLRAAEQIAAEPRRWASALAWGSPYPTTANVRQLGELLITLTGTGRAVRSASQLGARVNILRYHRGNIRALIQNEVRAGNLPTMPSRKRSTSYATGRNSRSLRR